MTDHKKQHWVPKAYLTEWGQDTDPNRKIRKFDKSRNDWDSDNPRNPEKLFKKFFIYSVSGSNG